MLLIWVSQGNQGARCCLIILTIASKNCQFNKEMKIRMEYFENDFQRVRWIFYFHCYVECLAWELLILFPTLWKASSNQLSQDLELWSFLRPWYFQSSSTLSLFCIHLMDKQGYLQNHLGHSEGHLETFHSSNKAEGLWQLSSTGKHQSHTLHPSAK